MTKLNSKQRERKRERAFSVVELDILKLDALFTLK